MQRSSTWVAATLQSEPIGPACWLTGVSIDTRTCQPGQLFVPLVAARDGHDFIDEAMAQGICCALWQADHPLPKVTQPFTFIRVPDTQQALWDLAAVYRQEQPGRVVAITGSHGKTTTKNLLAAVLGHQYRVHKTEGNFNNQLGVPLTLLAWPELASFAILELGMRAAGEIGALSRLAKPDMALLTSASDAHGARLGGAAGVLAAKLEIVEGLSPEGQLFYDGENPALVEAVAELVRQGKVQDPVPIVTSTAITARGRHGMDFWTPRPRHRYLFPYFGEHNVKNALFAIQVGRAVGMKERTIQRGLQRVPVTPGRLALSTGPGPWVLDDSYNASPTSVCAAIDALLALTHSERRQRRLPWAVLGTMAELAGDVARHHAEVARYAAEQGVQRLFAVGEYAEGMVEAFCSVRQRELRATAFPTTDAACAIRPQANAVILVKASRVMQLERIVAHLRGEGKEEPKDGDF